MIEKIWSVVISWNPNEVKTPVPTMLATTKAAAAHIEALLRIRSFLKNV